MRKNKALSALMIIGAVLLIAGLIMTLFGFISGGSINELGYWNGRNYNFGFRSNNLLELEDKTFTEENEVSSLSLKIAYGEITIIPSSAENRVEVTNYRKNGLEISVINGELRVHDTQWDKVGYSWNGKHDNKTPTFNIYLTKDALKNLTIDFGAGYISAEGLTVDNFVQSIGAGEVVFKNFNIKNYTLDIGAGQADLKDFTVDNFNVSVGAGQLLFQGDITSYCSVSGGVGDIEFDLSGPASQYYFTCTQGVGSVKINNQNYFGSGNDEVGNPSAPTKINIEAGVGSIDIKTR